MKDYDVFISSARCGLSTAPNLPLYSCRFLPSSIVQSRSPDDLSRLVR